MRGSIGSASVWDEATRQRRARPPEPLPPPSPRLASELRMAPDELSALVAGIVQATLDTQLADHGPARRTAVARELETRLLALFAPLPGAAPVAAPPAEVVPEPPPAPAPSGGAPAGPAAAVPPARRALELVLEERLGRLGGPLAARADLRARLIALALGVPQPEESGEETASPEELSTLDVLQRRAAKLEQALREARAALAHVSTLEHVDEGLASIYRMVQGLALDDPHHMTKRDALERIFRANLALRSRAE